MTRRILRMTYAIRPEITQPLDDDPCAASRAIESCLRYLYGQPNIDPASIRFTVEDPDRCDATPFR